MRKHMPYTNKREERMFSLEEKHHPTRNVKITYIA